MCIRDRLKHSDLDRRIGRGGLRPRAVDEVRLVADPVERAEDDQIVHVAGRLSRQGERVRYDARHDVEVRLGHRLSEQPVDRFDGRRGLIRGGADRDLDVGVGRRRLGDESMEAGLRDRGRVDRAGGEQRGSEERDERRGGDDRPVGARPAQADEPRAEERTNQRSAPGGTTIAEH